MNISPCFRISTHLQVNISRRRQARQLTGGGGVLLHAQRSEHVKGRSRQDPKCGLSAMGLAVVGNINGIWVKVRYKRIVSRGFPTRQCLP